MKKKRKKIQKLFIRFIQIILEWLFPFMLFLSSFVLSVYLPFTFYFTNGRFDIIKASVIIPLLIIFIYISTKISKRWWKWLFNHDIIA